MKGLAIILFFAAVMRASSQSFVTIETASPSVWITPLDLSLGHRATLTADQIYDSVFTLRFEVRRITSNQGKSYLFYRWFVRNKLDRTLSIAVPRRLPPPINPQGLGHVYGATWVSNGPSPLSGASLYGAHTKNAVGWSRSEQHLPNDSHYVEWLPLQPEQEYEIYSRFVPATEPVEAAVFSVPFQINKLAGKAFLCSMIQ